MPRKFLQQKHGREKDRRQSYHGAFNRDDDGGRPSLIVTGNVNCVPLSMVVEERKEIS